MTHEEYLAVLDGCDASQRQKIAHGAEWANMSLWAWLDAIEEHADLSPDGPQGLTG